MFYGNIMLDLGVKEVKLFGGGRDNQFTSSPHRAGGGQ